MNDKNHLNSQKFSNATCAVVLHENLENFLSAANKRALELTKENEMLQKEVKYLKSKEEKCDKCSNVYPKYSHLFQPTHVKIKKQPCVIEMKFPNTEAVINYINVSPNLQITNLNKVLSKYSSRISENDNV